MTLCSKTGAQLGPGRGLRRPAALAFAEGHPTPPHGSGSRTSQPAAGAAERAPGQSFRRGALPRGHGCRLSDSSQGTRVRRLSRGSFVRSGSDKGTTGWRSGPEWRVVVPLSVIGTDKGTTGSGGRGLLAWEPAGSWDASSLAEARSSGWVGGRLRRFRALGSWTLGGGSGGPLTGKVRVLRVGGASSGGGAEPRAVATVSRQRVTRPSRADPRALAGAPAYGYNVAPVSRSTIEIATAGHASAASIRTSSGASPITTATSSSRKTCGATSTQSPWALHSFGSTTAM